MVPANMTHVFRATVIGPLISIGRKQKMGMLMWKPFQKEDVDTLKELVQTGKITPVVDRNYSLSEVAEALRYQAEGRARGKIVITI